MESCAADKDIRRCIAESAELRVAPDGNTYLVISLKAKASLCSSQRVPVKEVELTALQQETVPL